MTEEQIKQNAEEYILPLKTLPGADENIAFIAAIREAHIAGAHSLDEEVESVYRNFKEEFDTQERQLNELSNDNKDLEQALACAEDVVDIQRKELDQLRNPWINVGERLPEEGQSVLVEFYNGNHATCNYTNGEFVFSLVIDTPSIKINSTATLSIVTHWMPIQPIKKGGEE